MKKNMEASSPLIVTFLLALCFVGFSHSQVVDLDPNNFKSEVLDSDALWIIKFYAPWCGHCQSFKPDFFKAARIMKGIVKLGYLNADQHKSLAAQYGIQGFPTIKIFAANKQRPEEYNGPRSASGLVDAAKNQLTAMLNQRLSSGGTGGSGGRSSGDSGRGGDSGSHGHRAGDPKDVIELTDSNFQQLVLDSDDIWLVEFYAPWCGHCKNLAPHWQSAASHLRGRVKLGALDATVHQVMSNRYGIRGFPTIKYFPGGKKDGNAEEYDGGRTTNDIVNWAMEKFAENIPAPPAKEITSGNVLKEACEGSQLCVISILPVIYDCQSKCRKDFISLIESMGEKYKRRMWGWVWAEAGAQPELEDAFGIGGFGYPAMAALNYRSMKYSPLKGSFSEQGLTEFFRELLYGRSSTVPLKNAKLPEIRNLDPWDGKDKQLPVEEDIDLSDVELEDLGGAKTEL